MQTNIANSASNQGNTCLIFISYLLFGEILQNKHLPDCDIGMIFFCLSEITF